MVEWVTSSIFFNCNVPLHKCTTINYPFFLCCTFEFPVFHFYDTDAMNILISIKSLIKRPKQNYQG